MRRYAGVRGGRRVAAIIDAVVASGGRVIEAPDPRRAPFELVVETPHGVRIPLVCYAFTANKYLQDGRPGDEHRFQVKYGNDFHRPHSLFHDETRETVTLFFGFHEEEGLFIAADPEMHNPTWFSMSVEFKEGELRAAARDGWHGWERERVAAGRRRIPLQADLRTEVLVAFRPEHFLTYVQFERVASSMDPGERLRLIEKVGDDLRRGGQATSLSAAVRDLISPAIPEHALLAQFGLTAEQLLDVVGKNFRLLTAIRGGVAEHHLGEALKRMRGITDVSQIDQDGAPDFSIRYRGKIVRVECKNVLRKLTRGIPRVDFQKTRASKSDPCSRYYAATQFEVLAACLHPVTEKWEFRYCATADLKPHGRCPERLSDRVLVEGPQWADHLGDLLPRFV